MLVTKMILKRVDRQDLDAQSDALHSLLSSYRLDGHILGREFTIVALDDHLEAYPVSPAIDAFENKHANSQIENKLCKLSSVGLGNPEFVLLNGSPIESNRCNCSDSKGFILFTNYLTIQSPVRCSTCFGQVPLYSLPRFETGDFAEVISWASDYVACDSLYMNSATGVRYCYNHLSQFSSSLSKRGRAICDRITLTTTKPVYYYLLRHQGRRKKAEIARNVPTVEVIGCYRLSGTTFLTFAAIGAA